MKRKKKFTILVVGGVLGLFVFSLLYFNLFPLVQGGGEAVKSTVLPKNATSEQVAEAINEMIR